MWLELAGSGAAWLAHALWYLGRAKRRLWAHRLRPLLPWLSLPLLGTAFACWIGEHGAALGACAALAALAAAASVNALLAPVRPLALGVTVAASLAALGAGLLGWVLHAV